MAISRDKLIIIRINADFSISKAHSMASNIGCILRYLVVSFFSFLCRLSIPAPLRCDAPFGFFLPVHLFLRPPAAAYPPDRTLKPPTHLCLRRLRHRPSQRPIGAYGIRNHANAPVSQPFPDRPSAFSPHSPYEYPSIISVCVHPARRRALPEVSPCPHNAPGILRNGDRPLSGR